MDPILAKQESLPAGYFAVEKILDKRIVEKETEYLVSWVGYPSSFNQWVKTEWVLRKDCITKFERERKLFKQNYYRFRNKAPKLQRLDRVSTVGKNRRTRPPTLEKFDDSWEPCFRKRKPQTPARSKGQVKPNFDVEEMGEDIGVAERTETNIIEVQMESDIGSREEADEALNELLKECSGGRETDNEMEVLTIEDVDEFITNCQGQSEEETVSPISIHGDSAKELTGPEVEQEINLLETEVDDVTLFRSHGDSEDEREGVDTSLSNSDCETEDEITDAPRTTPLWLRLMIESKRQGKNDAEDDSIVGVSC